MPALCAYSRPTTQRVTSAARSSIPPELTDRIIDFLHNDWEALKSCCLTCKAWLPASRYHLWHSVVLRFTTSSDEKAYAEFLKSSPIITSGIVDLTIEFGQPRRGSSRQPELDWIEGTLVPIFSTLRLLRQLMFVNASFGGGRAEDGDKTEVFLSTIATKLSSIRTLQFSLCHFSKFSQYVELVWGCPNLETLRLDNVTFDNIDAYVPRPPAVPRLQLKFLMIIFYSSHMPTVIDWLISEDLCSHLDFLVVFQLQIESPAVRRLLPVIGSHLRHLSISYAFVPMQPGTENDLFPTISHCTDLRSLNFLFAGSGSLAWIPIVISQINSPYVEEIDLGITDIFSPDDFERFDWASLWRSLTAKKFIRLRSVRFMVAAVSGDSFSNTKERITRHLKGVDTKGLIQVESVSPEEAFPTG